ncbi:MAG: phosphoribosylformylglycinamidine cyclo-ligase [Anaerolineae bacterium]|nr:phosphoribosylformylglycinamidine cyclo-ligase [Anaerolineae bacterium]
MTQSSQYAAAGVDIDTKMHTINLIKEAVRSTYRPEVLSDTGSFGGLFSAAGIKGMNDPVLVASTDGVGTKTKVATKMDRWDTIGQDIVNHCVNDILVQGARPLFFLDYVASSQIIPEQVAKVVEGMAVACRVARCALLGGETPEMPGVYLPGEIDVVGTIVGVVERGKLITGSRIRPGDAIIGLVSSGLHTNGYSLARHALADLDWTSPYPGLGGESIGEVLLKAHLSYLGAIEKLWAADIDIHGMAHLTGGGFIDNPPRVFPEGVGAIINRRTWPVPPIFDLIQELGKVSNEEMFRVFNMGLGMLVIVPAEQASLVLTTLPFASYRVGEIVAGKKEVAIK